MKKPQKTTKPKVKKKREGPISLYPLDFEQAIKGLIHAPKAQQKKD